LSNREAEAKVRLRGYLFRLDIRIWVKVFETVISQQSMV